MRIVYAITLGSKALNPRGREDFSRDMVDSLNLGVRTPYALRCSSCNPTQNDYNTELRE